MAKKDTIDLVKFLQPFTPEIQELALWLRDFIWDIYPESNELIYDNYNALAVGWSPSDRVSDTFCSIAVGSNKYVHFGFYWGAKIADPEKILLGKGNQYRYIIIREKNDLPQDYIKKLMAEAYEYSINKVKDKTQPLKGATITKSISPVQKRPGIIQPKRKSKNSA
jgi:hypothetical protein